MGADATSICSDIFFLVGNANNTLQEIAITDSLALFKQQVGSLAIEWGTIVNQKAVRSVNTL
jgi:hypothetical protein